MSVKLLIQIDGPVGVDDLPILNGTAMIVMALAGRVIEDAEKTPGEEEEEASEDELVEEVARVFGVDASAPDPKPCGHPQGGGTGRVCMGEVGHRGRHLYRRPAPLAN